MTKKKYETPTPAENYKWTVFSNSQAISECQQTCVTKREFLENRDNAHTHREREIPSPKNRRTAENDDDDDQECVNLLNIKND